MSQTFDVNILVYASNGEAPEHERASALLHHLAAGPELVVVLWPVVMGYLRIATHPSVFARPLRHADAVANVEALTSRPHVRLVAPGGRFWETYRSLAEAVPVRGSAVPDAQIAALMLEHGVRTLWSRDRGFRKYDHLQVRDPFSTRYDEGFS